MRRLLWVLLGVGQSRSRMTLPRAWAVVLVVVVLPCQRRPVPGSSTTSGSTSAPKPRSVASPSSLAGWEPPSPRRFGSNLPPAVVTSNLFLIDVVAAKPLSDRLRVVCREELYSGRGCLDVAGGKGSLAYELAVAPMTPTLLPKQPQADATQEQVRLALLAVFQQVKLTSNLLGVRSRWERSQRRRSDGWR